MFKLYYGLYMVMTNLSPAPESEICSMDTSRLVEQLKRHEGVEYFPYVDTVGKITIGAGRNLTDRGITVATINQMLDEDINLATSELDRHYPSWCNLTENRQLVLANMSYNLGMPRYKTFKRFWAALRQENWELASEEMLSSKWADQVGDRAIELADMMKSG